MLVSGFCFLKLIGNNFILHKMEFRLLEVLYIDNNNTLMLGLAYR